MGKRKLIAATILFLAISLVAIGCGGESQKMSAVKDWLKTYAKAYADSARQYVGERVEKIMNAGIPDRVRLLEEEKYPYNPKRTYGDVLTGGFELKGSSVVIYLRVPIGEEDTELAEKLTGKKAEEYVAEAKVILHTDQKNLDYDNLLDARITKIEVKDPEIVVGED